ncbi:MAG: hypothetical protein NTW51_09580 [Cyanobacteria bacterium]|jgi:hypothetical protein|nr:hypothetical protein [Cyanobacteriota bacterium]
MVPLRRTVPLASLSLGLSAGLTLATGLTTSLAAGPAWAAEAPYPPATTFREVQLTAFSCGRDNTQADCDKARRLADPLLDHPRLSTACKDALWSVRQLSVVTPQNSPERRDPIDKASRDVAAYCRQPYVADTTQPTTNPGGKPFSFKALNP